ncbi:hypothetical protein [Sinorhizobium meliloti]
MAEADQPGVRIGDVARHHDIYPAQIVSATNIPPFLL